MRSDWDWCQAHDSARYYSFCDGPWGLCESQYDAGIKHEKDAGCQFGTEAPDA